MKPPAHNDQQSLNQLEAQEEQTQEAVALGEEPPPSESEQQQAQEQQEYLSSPASDPRLTKLRDEIQKTKDVKANSVSLPTLNKSDTAALFSAVPKSSPTSKKTQDLVNKLRDDVIPKAIKGTQLTVYVGGTTAGNIDLAEKLGSRTPLVIIIIVGLSFLLLTLAFRTIVVPAIAALLNLFAVAAAYGILTAVFEKGWGVELIGLEHSLPVVSYVPLLMFAILFGLSTDYTVFLLTRVSEEYAIHGDHRKAIVVGLGRAARVIIAAAAIMVFVFASFILNGDPTVKQFGVGFAVAVAIDAAVVCIVLPAAMLLCGRATWFLPKLLDRVIPNLGIEGEDYFNQRDARAEGNA
jgi:RND superfamily putative drug exporter